MEPDRIIQLRVSNQRAYVWDVDDLAYLRAKHHVCGVLTGTLPHVSQQNVFLGMPLVLMPEEVVLLVEKQLAVLVDDPAAHRTPTHAALAKWNATCKAQVRAQLEHEATKGEQEESVAAKRAMSEEAVRKRKEREEKKAALARAKAAEEGQGEGDSVVLPEVQVQESQAQVVSHSGPSELSLAQATYTVTVPGKSNSNLPWYSPQDATYTTIEDAIKAGIWTYPSNAHERAKCHVFRDLREKGHYMGGGIKFGGDYLVYPGDPLRYHSHFVASVVDSPTAKIAPMEIVAHGRLGTATKKAHLLCTWDEEKQTVSYYSVEWAGFG